MYPDLNDGGDDPEEVWQQVVEEQVDVDLVAKAAELPRDINNTIKSIYFSLCFEIEPKSHWVRMHEPETKESR